MKKTLPVSVLIVIILIWTVAAEAQWWKPCIGGGRGMGPGWRSDFSGINLTEDQQKKFDTLYQGCGKDVAKLNNKLGQKQLEMNSLLLEPNPDQSRIASLQKELSGLQSDLNDKRIHYQLEARKILTPEQVAQMPPVCSLGFGSMMGGYGAGYGCGRGPGYGCGRGPGYGCGMGAGYGPRCGWW
jgi:Spy/CpxP family protein refolding chaperone